MSDLNKKNINYGALNRFYQDLKNHDLSDLNDKIDNIDVPEYSAGEGIAIDSANTISCTVKPIADVSVLPDAEANKDSVLRLNGDKQVYISKYGEMEVPITPTNRLPDAQQIDKAYLYETYKSCYYYKGTYTVIFDDIEVTGYGWLADFGENGWYFILTEDNAENIQTDANAYGFLTGDNGDEIDLTNKTVTTSNVSSEYKYTLGYFGLTPISAIYNVPESAQISNAAFYDDGQGYDAIYSGDEVTYDGATWYKWVFDGEDSSWLLSSKPASEIYGNFEEYWKSDVRLVITDGENYTEYGSEDEYASISNIFIQQKNAPESEQVGNAYISYSNVQWTYNGENATVSGNGSTYTGYKWVNGNDYIISTKKAEELYYYIHEHGQSRDIITPDNDFVNSVGTTLHFYEENGDSINVVKYKRTTGLGFGYQWNKVVTEDEIVPEIGENESVFTGTTLTVDGTQPSIVASGTTTIVWDDLASSIPSGKTVEVSVVLINTGNSALTPTMSGNVQMMGDGNLTIQASELGLYRGRYISALNKWLIEAIYQEVSGIME